MTLDDWFEKSCQIGYTPRPIMFMNPTRNDTYVTELQTILTNVLKVSEVKHCTKLLIYALGNIHLDFTRINLFLLPKEGICTIS